MWLQQCACGGGEGSSGGIGVRDACGQGGGGTSGGGSRSSGGCAKSRYQFPVVATLGTLEHFTRRNFVRLFVASKCKSYRPAPQQLVVGSISQPRRKAVAPFLALSPSCKLSCAIFSLLSSIFNLLSSILNLLPSIFHLSSSIFHLQSFIFHLPSILFNHQPSIEPLQSSSIHPLQSSIYPINLPYSIFKFQSSIFHLPPSILYL